MSSFMFVLVSMASFVWTNVTDRSCSGPSSCSSSSLSSSSSSGSLTVSSGMGFGVGGGVLVLFVILELSSVSLLLFWAPESQITRPGGGGICGCSVGNIESVDSGDGVYGLGCGVEVSCSVLNSVMLVERFVFLVGG